MPAGYFREAGRRIGYTLVMARKTQIPPKTFEDALAELDQILTNIENGKVGLEESLLKYERGNYLIQHCRGVLNAAEKQMELLSRGPDGSIVATAAPSPADETAPEADES
jgi:exodeoxyribonuclease VII small subunit